MSSPSNPAVAFKVCPTAKFVVFSYLLTIVLVSAAAGIWYQRQARPQFLYLILGLGALGIFATARRHIRLRFTSLAYDGHGLKFQDGFMSKSTRLLNLSKIQDVRVDQGIADRLLGIGTITFETAGESGRLVMENIDHPQDVAHRILALAQSAGGPHAQQPRA